ncbi:hypothetical protein RGUI_2846 [Rhodovulum sp. P5]|uniref:hypothetical protein n=1 Tax=Rhodovulum sp. P5 TaxID=1564506 RepID=UPI0009C37800|nr:hypothetical protein [Rhodovulum sp. P5]ARE40987.1 hypothetical protein RGUI_2846 [Rhodovulum sp. P5]
MNRHAKSPETAPHALIAALEAEVARDVETILSDAEAEAADIVARARHRNRRRFRRAAARMRSERAATLAKAHAKAHRARHQVFLAENARIAETGLGTIESCLAELWGDPAVRAAWCRNAVKLTCDRLGDVEHFVVEHPDPLPDETRRALLDALAEAGCRAPELRPDPSLRVGIRLRSDHACLDATPAGLLRDRARIAGEYLAVLGRGEEQHDG